VWESLSLMMPCNLVSSPALLGAPVGVRAPAGAEKQTSVLDV
jgi:hypothetical protein